MNLIQQFPDASMQMRSQSRSAKKLRIERFTLPINETESALALFYDNEFRKWHYKLLFIIAFVIAGLYGAVLALSFLLN